MATLYKEYTVPAGTFVNESFRLSGYTQGGQAAPPAWFAFVDGAEVLGIQTYTGYQFTAPASLGTYDIFFTTFDLAITYYVRVNVVIGQYTLANNCCGDRNIAWFTIQGGWQNYIFSGVTTFQVQAGKEKTFKTSGYVSKYSEISDVFDGEIVTTGDIPKSHVDVLATLKLKTVQAYLLNDETGLWDIPILIDRESFTKYKSNDKLFEVRLKFLYAEEILIQTQ